MKNLKKIFVLILALTMLTGVFAIQAGAIDPKRYVIEGSKFSSKEVDCGQFTFFYSAQKDITKAIETAEQLTQKKYFIGWPSGRRYLTEAEAQMSASDLNADHASHLHTSDVNGQITVNGTPNGFNIIVFTAPYTGDYQYTGKAHGWWTDKTTIEVAHNGQWYTAIPTVKDGDPNINTSDMVSMQAGDKLYFIYNYRSTEGYDPVTWDVFQIDFLGNDEPEPEQTTTPEETTTPADTDKKVENNDEDTDNNNLPLIIGIAAAVAVAAAVVVTIIVKKKKA